MPGSGASNTAAASGASSGAVTGASSGASSGGSNGASSSTATGASSGAATTVTAASSGAGGTTGSASSGSSGGSTSGAVCVSSGGFDEFESCSAASDCDCPNHCVTDLGISLVSKVCELPCTTTADCDQQTVCVSGVCNRNFCSGNQSGYQGIDAGYNRKCAATDAGDGWCVQMVGPGSDGTEANFGACVAGGTVAAAGTCATANLGDSSLDAGCGPGYLCIASTSQGVGTCTQICDPTDQTVGAGCSAEFYCQPVDNTPRTGICAVVSSCTTAGGSAGDQQTCKSNSDCACPLTCEDAGSSAICVYPCASNADCFNPKTSCQPGSVGDGCFLNFCAMDDMGHTAPGSLAGSCDALGYGDGTASCMKVCDPNVPNTCGTTLCTVTEFTSCSVLLSRCAAMPPGASCTSGTTCCGLHCDDNLNTCCLGGLGTDCETDDDCCTETGSMHPVCQPGGGLFAPAVCRGRPGAICTSNASCLSNNCDAGVPFDQCACAAKGVSCDANSDCCSNSCAGICSTTSGTCT